MKSLNDATSVRALRRTESSVRHLARGVFAGALLALVPSSLVVAAEETPKSNEVQFRTAPKPPSPFRITPLRVLVALLVVAGSFLIWQRVKKRPF